MRAQLLAASLIAITAPACAGAHARPPAAEAPAAATASGPTDDSTRMWYGRIDALRYFAPTAQLDSLRRTPADERAQAWAAFADRSGQPLNEYLDRVREADKRYRGEHVPGWTTDRGQAYLRLGDPDQVFVEPDVEIWLYTRYFGRLKFRHEAERWRLIPESHAMLETLVARARSVR